MLFSGIDLHKRSVAIHTLDAAGTVVRTAKLPAHRRALATYFDTLPGPHRAVVECTGMWYWVRDLLVPQGIDLRLGHAKYLTSREVQRDDACGLARTPAPRGLAAHGSTRALAVAGPPHRTPAAGARAAHPGARLVWIPGIGPLVAYTLLLEIDDIRRFPTVRHFHSYCRLVPGADDSAASRKHKRSRDGNRYLKLAFPHAAVRAAQYNPEIQAEYRRLIRRKGKAIARALIAKELGSIVYHVLTRQEAFNGRFRGLQLTRLKPRRWPRLASPPA